MIDELFVIFFPSSVVCVCALCGLYKGKINRLRLVNGNVLIVSVIVVQCTVIVKVYCNASDLMTNQCTIRDSRLLFPESFSTKLYPNRNHRNEDIFPMIRNKE